MVLPIPEINGCSIVLVGTFPPEIFHPEWFVEKEILAKEEIQDVEISLISQNASMFRTSWLHFYVDRQRMQILSETSPLIRVHDLALGILSFFAETSVHFLGINNEVHLKMETEAAWSALGDMLVPKSCWPPEFSAQTKNDEGSIQWAGLRSLVMQKPRNAPPGHTQVRVEPSLTIGPYGVNFAINEHFVLQSTPELPSAGSRAAEIITKNWEKIFESAEETRNFILRKLP